jgi:putative nucleotidyltransferase with HDIG domain
VSDMGTDDRLETPEELAEVSAGAKRTTFASVKKLERARDLVRAVAVAQTNAQLYPASHPSVVQSNADLVSAAAGVMEMGFEEITVNVYKGTLFVEDHVLPEESVTYRKLIEELLARGISALTLTEMFGPTDAAAFIDLLAATDVTDIDAAAEFLTARGAGSVRVAETTTLDESATEELGRENKAKARGEYDAGVQLMNDVETRAKLGRVFEIEPLQRMVNNLLNSLFVDPAAVLGLTAIKSHDHYTLNHSINVCILSLSLGASLGLDADSLRSLGLSALLYDLGKVRVPEGILNKESPLTADEWAVIKGHATEGADLLKRIQLTDQMPMIVAYEHHQRHDMQGYPEPRGTQEQHLFSKVVALCDAYDAMTTSRPFRREIRPDKALAVLMQGRGKAYDPSLTKALVAMLGIYPMGAVVRLDDASTGIVYRVNRDDLLRPRVKALIDVDGRWLGEPTIIDLRVVDPDTGSWARSIAECIPAADAGIDDVWDYL